MAVTINASTSAGAVITPDTSGVLALQTAGTTAVSISTGQVATFAQAPVLPAASIPQAALAAGVAGNGPSVFAYSAAAQALTGGVYTKITFDTELWDTNNNFSSSRFTPTVAGYYQITTTCQTAGTASLGPYIAKNGSVVVYGTTTAVLSYGIANMSALVYCNGSTDYIESFCYFSATLNTSPGAGTVNFQAAMVRSA